MDLRATRYFEEVARTGSLRKAAERLRIASSALSRSIALLEDELGIQLFQRAGRGMELTAAGEIYLRYCQNALRSADRVRSELDDLKGLRRGTIRIVSIEGLVANFISHVIVRFRAQHPGVLFTLNITGSNLVKKAMRTREADFGIGAGGDDEEEDESGLQMVHHIRDPILAVMSPRYPLAGADELDAADLIRNHPVAIPDATFSIRNQIELLCRQKKVPLNPALVTNSTDALRGFARLGGGITFLPWLAVQRDMEDGSLIGIRVSESLFNSTTFNIFTPVGWRHTPAAMSFLNELKASAEILVDLRNRGSLSPDPGAAASGMGSRARPGRVDEI